MDPVSRSIGRSGSLSGQEIAEEIQRSVMENLLLQNLSPPETGSSFTALLGLPANQAMELLHEPDSGESTVMSGIEICRDELQNQRTLNYAFNSSETSQNSLKLKNEPTNSESNPSSSPIFSYGMTSNAKQRTTKTKERDRKVKVSSKKSKNVDNVKLKTEEQSEDGEKVPYVHVRARRGQATDSHSLAERARREKINARMKLLQGLVPGCTKISGMALVLDEIINHVQSLQSQVEFLSMRLAAVNPRIDFSIDSLLAAESGCLTVGMGTVPSTALVESSMWSIQVNDGTGQQLQNQQLLHHDVLRSQIWERNSQNYINSPEDSVFS